MQSRSIHLCQTCKPRADYWERHCPVPNSKADTRQPIHATKKIRPSKQQYTEIGPTEKQAIETITLHLTVLLFSRRLFKKNVVSLKSKAVCPLRFFVILLFSDDCVPLFYIR